MPYEALSECVKCQKQSKLKEEKISQVVEAYRAEQAKPEPQKGVCAIAKAHGIENSYKTIINRYNNGRSIREAHKEQQKLTTFLSPLLQAPLIDLVMMITMQSPRRQASGCV